MHRFFVPSDGFQGDIVYIRGSDAIHLRDVLRLKLGDIIHALDGNGFCFQVRLTAVLKKGVEGKILSKVSLDVESPLEIRLGQAILKGNKFDGVIRKAVEMGTRSIVPMITKRTIARVSSEVYPKKAQRWQKISEEAGKQSGRSYIARVEKKPLDVEKFCESVRDYDLKLCFWEDESCYRLKSIEPKHPPLRIATLIGPEGGFDHEEIEVARMSGFLTISLGPRLLRAETVPIAALAILQNRWGDV